MDKDFLFTIVVPVYNVEKFLPKCLDSILAQNYENEYELIIINDGSSDDSSKILNEYKDKFENCLLIERENKGLVYTRVEGAKRARGKYIIFVDSDDYLPCNTLEIYDSILKEDDYDIIRGNYYRFEEDKTEEVVEFDKDYVIEAKDIVEKYYKELLTTNKFNSIWRQAIKKDIMGLDEVNTSISMGEDIEFNQACYKNAKQIKITTEKLYYYRRSSSSITKDYSIERLEKNIIDLSKVYDTIIRNIEHYNDNELLKLGYASYLKLLNYYCYMLVNNSNDKDRANQIIELIIKDKKTIEAKNILKYKDIPFKKTKLLLFLLMNGKKKIYILLLRILAKLGVKYNH